VEALITQTADQKIKPSRELFARQNRVQCERAFMVTFIWHVLAAFREIKKKTASLRCQSPIIPNPHRSL